MKRCWEENKQSLKQTALGEGRGSVWRAFVSRREDQVSREVAFGAQADGPAAGLQPHFVSRLQLEQRVTWWQVATSLINLETAQHLFGINLQVHISHTDNGNDEKAELIDTGGDAREQARIGAVKVLFVVLDLAEMNDFLWR